MICDFGYGSYIRPGGQVAISHQHYVLYPPTIIQENLDPFEKIAY